MRRGTCHFTLLDSTRMMPGLAFDARRICSACGYSWRTSRVVQVLGASYLYLGRI